MTTARQQGAGAGIQTSALFFGGLNPSVPPGGTAVTEEYDGSSWTNGGSLSAGVKRTQALLIWVV